MHMTREAITALLARRRDAVRRRDTRAFGELYAESARVDSPLAGQITGREAIMRAQDAVFTAFPDGVIVEDQPVIDGDRATVVADFGGTHTGEILGLPPTGRPFQIPVVFISVLRDNLIVSERRIYDFTGLLVQIGVLKAKPAS